MDGIKDFRVPLYMDIAHPNKGFFGYLLRCKCPQPEDVSGNFIFLDDGTDCCVKFPTAKKRRVESMLYYVHEELLEDFVDFMKGGSDDAIRRFFERFTEGVRASIIYNSLGVEPLYGISHVSQLADDGRLHWPHIHVLWGIKKH